MPQLGETVAEGKITTWFKSVGDKVAPGDNLFEIETDKVTMEVPAISAGVLAEIRVPEGEIAPVGAIVALISEAAIVGNGAQSGSGVQPVASSGAAAAPIKAQQPAKTQPPKAEVKKTGPVKLDPYREVRTPERNFGPAQLSNGITVTPLARRLASEANVDLSRVRGSGPRGRIVAADVQSAVHSGSGRTAAATAGGPSLAQVKALYKHVPYQEVPLDGMRKVIAARLEQASQSIPAFYLSLDVRMDRLLAVREEINAGARKDTDGNPAFKLSVNDFIVKALAMALQRVPAANAVWAEDRILRFQQSDVGVAVAVGGGLLTPVVRQAETKSVLAISAEMKDLAARARVRKLKPEEYQGGTTAVSNLGMFGIRQFTAIINPPHATILAVGASERRPVETENGGVKFVTAMSVTLTCDHRVVDGALGAELLGAFKTIVEAPSSMLI
ncbi:MAG TPA: pyruvate dehydrogenase complex dihydrolipoamide acetyltransferase [Bryobacteraceae bacterium]|nr:pyruvate dehydrogenase complex dihydrolipoamide acetyltransferase [Bryobacteraceae bacterium]